MNGGIGGNILTGNAGSDIFLYHGKSESTVAKPDRITDFGHAIDKFDFTSFGGISEIQGLISAGTDIAAHSITWLISGSDTHVLVNTNSGAEAIGAAQAKIVLTGNDLVD